MGEPVEEDVDLGGGVKLTMMLIPPGEFVMGSTEEEQARFLEEAKAANDTYAVKRIPSEGQHRVRITRPFRLSRHEVTVASFASSWRRRATRRKPSRMAKVETDT